MGHVQQSARCIPLYTHVLGFGESGKRLQGSRSSYLGFVVLMCRKIRDASNSVTLNFNVGRIHLLDQGSEPTKCDYVDFVFG